MFWILRAAIGLHVLTASVLASQQPPRWKVRGDTTGAPPGCSAAAAITVIDAWFTAFNAADSAGLARTTATASPRGWVVSTGRFVRSEPFVRIESLKHLVAYARERRRHHERLTLEGARFYGWLHGGGRELGFMPYYVRSADDLGAKPLPGIGKAAYLCGEGVIVLNLAPRPAGLPGLGA